MRKKRILKFSLLCASFFLGLYVVLFPTEAAHNSPSGGSGGGPPGNGQACIFGSSYKETGIVDNGVCIDNSTQAQSKSFQAINESLYDGGVCSFFHGGSKTLSIGYIASIPSRCGLGQGMLCYDGQNNTFNCAAPDGFYLTDNGSDLPSPPTATTATPTASSGSGTVPTLPTAAPPAEGAQCTLAYSNSKDHYSYTTCGLVSTQGTCNDGSNIAGYACNTTSTVGNSTSNSGNTSVNVECNVSCSTSQAPKTTQLPGGQAISTGSGTPAPIDTIKSQSKTVKSIYDIFIVMRNFLFVALVVIAIGLFVFGGFTYFTAGADVRKQKTARSTVLYTCIGLAIIALSVIIIRIVASVLGINISGIL